jgi:hypothetical protein
VLVGDYPAAFWPVAITSPPTSAIALRTAGLAPLPPGVGMTTRGGFVTTWSGSRLSFSAGDWTHLYDPTRHFVALPAPILGAVGVDGGVWATSARTLYWIGGADLNKAGVVVRHTGRDYAAGGDLLPPEWTGLQTAQPVAAFVSSDGLVYGTADGQALAPMRLTQRWDVTGKRASLARWETDGEKYIVVGGL